MDEPSICMCSTSLPITNLFSMFVTSPIDVVYGKYSKFEFSATRTSWSAIAINRKHFKFAAFVGVFVKFALALKASRLMTTKKFWSKWFNSFAGRTILCSYRELASNLLCFPSSNSRGSHRLNDLFRRMTFLTGGSKSHGAVVSPVKVFKRERLTDAALEACVILVHILIIPQRIDK